MRPDLASQNIQTHQIGGHPQESVGKEGKILVSTTSACLWQKGYVIYPRNIN